MTPVIVARALTVSVLRPAGAPDATLGGISSNYARLAIVGYTIRDRAAQLRHGTATEVHEIPGAPTRNIIEEEPPVILVVIEDLHGTRTARFTPATWDATRSQWKEDPQWWMAGGNYATTSDSRLSDIVTTLLGERFYGALAIHDRNEA